MLEIRHANLNPCVLFEVLEIYVSLFELFPVWGSQNKFTCGRISGSIESLLSVDRYGRTDGLLVDDLKSVPVLIDL